MNPVTVRPLVLETMEDAARELARLKADPFTLRSLAPRMIHHTLAVRGATRSEAEFLRRELQSLGGEAFIPQDGDPAGGMLLAGTEKQLDRLCRLLEGNAPSRRLAQRIRTALEGWSDPAIYWDVAGRRLDLSRPLIMGILNVTPDSFSDGGRWINPQQAVDHALEMVESGADIIDIGGESTRPFAPPVAEDEELRRIVPVLEKLQGKISVPLSIDTYKASVARQAVEGGCAIVNDVSGLTFDPAMAETIAATGAGAVLMHTRGRPSVMQAATAYDDLLGDVAESLAQSLAFAAEAGIAPERLVLDPGIGFGKSREGNLELLRRLRELSFLGRPLLVGTSRKGFTASAGGRKAHSRISTTAATVALAVANGASILRVHDVKEMRDVADMAGDIVTRS